MRTPRKPDLEFIEAAMTTELGEGPVAAAAAYHLKAGGGRIRAMLALEAGVGLVVDRSSVVACACAAELLHNASLIHDDVQEQDRSRRGRPALWHEFDVATAICAGDLMISAAYASLAGHPSAGSALKLMHEAVSLTARGQSEDMTGEIRTLSQYHDLVAAKTAPLLALPVRLVLCAAGPADDRTAVDASRHLAVAYQALDDLNDRDADRAEGRVNLCTLFEARGASPSDAAQMARVEAMSALGRARTVALQTPRDAGRAFLNLADRLDSALTEFSHAA